MRAVILIGCVVSLHGCNGKTAPAEGQGEDLISIRVCQGAPDTSCSSYDGAFAMGTDCYYLYSKPGTAWGATAPAKECSVLLDVVRSTAFQDALKNSVTCGGKGEVAILKLASGAVLSKDISGCEQKPFVDLRNAIDAVTSSYRPDGGVDASGSD